MSHVMVDQPEATSSTAGDDAERRAFFDDLRASGWLDRIYDEFRARRARQTSSFDSPPSAVVEAPTTGNAAIELRLSAVETRLGQVETRLAVVETKLEGVTSQMEKLETRLGAVEAKLEGRLDAIEAKFDGRFTDIETKFDGRLNDVDGRLGTVEAKQISLDGRMAQIEARLEKVESRLEASVRELREQARTDFRLLFGALITGLLGLASLMAKGFHWL